jgi:hypothetical protein
VPPTGGVAVRSTFSRLTSSFEPDPDDPRARSYQTGVFVGTVGYVDYTRDTIPEGNALWPFIHKRLSFAFERELRALFTMRPSEPRSPDEEPAPTPPGQQLPVALETMIEEIRVSPIAPAWFADLVRRVCERYTGASACRAVDFICPRSKKWGMSDPWREAVAKDVEDRIAWAEVAQGPYLEPRR